MRVLPAGVTLAALLLAGCGDLPQPFRHDGSPEAPRPQAARAVVVVPPAGPGPGPALAAAVVRALLEAEIPASTRPLPGESAWTLAADSESRDGTVRLHWRLSRGDRPPFDLTRSLPAAAWTAATPALTDGLAAELVTALLPALDETPPPEPAAAPPGPRLRLIPPTGLPGDGDAALAAAMRRRLADSGLTLVEGDTPADLTLRVQSVVTPLPDGDRLALVWRLSDTADHELGQASQQGAVPHGRLDRPWGSLADDIAAGGVEGVLDVLRKARR
ncbi:hypothetical protein [Phaeospirillum tilakii]|uniref:Lipoprotein n=1 Tax=Phaeospirillum tilakii TaxID=741673 RepID=A0ABW5CGH5_9PROT